MNAIQLERMRTLYALMVGVPEKKVELVYWRRGAVNDDSLKNSDCGTTGCAVGWACAYPPFIEQGLYWTGSCPAFKDERNWSAVQEFFGLSHREADGLFLTGSRVYDGELNPRLYSDKAIVIRRIRRFLFERGHISRPRNIQLAAEEGMPL